MVQQFELEEYGPPEELATKKTKVEEKSESWAAKAEPYNKAASRLLQQYQEQTQRAYASHQGIFGKQTNPITKFLFGSPLVDEEAKKQAEISYKLYIMNEFYSQLYTAVPGLVSSGKSAGEYVPYTMDEILSIVKPPSNMSITELENAKTVVSQIMDDMSQESISEQAQEEFLQTRNVSLVAPTGPLAPTSISMATTDAIIKYASMPSVPDPILSEEEYNEYLVAANWISADSNPEDVAVIQTQLDEYVKWLKETSDQREAILEHGIDFPSQSTWSKIKFMALEPGIGLLDLASNYFEYVTQPLAGAVFWAISPDIRKKWTEYKKSDNAWKALGEAWQAWDPDLPVLDDTAAEWILKYMIMEGATDPLTYLGFGLYARMARPFGMGAYRAVEGFETGYLRLVEKPFDWLKAPLKYKWTPEALEMVNKKLSAVGLPKLAEHHIGSFLIPRTKVQQATIQMYKAGQHLDKYLSNMFSKSVRDITQEELDRGISTAVKYGLAHPADMDSDIARAARQLLSHTPVSRDETVELAKLVNSTLSTIPESTEITIQTADMVDKIFENWFMSVNAPNKIIETKEAAKLLLNTLNASDESLEAASKWLIKRHDTIVNSALGISSESNTVKAIRNLMQRNYKIAMNAIDSDVALARAKQGYISAHLGAMSDRVQRVWTSKIDQFFVKSPAELYLMFTMYGYMNVFEDVIRTALGGVDPRPLLKYSYKGLKGEDVASEVFLKFQRKWAGTAYEYRFADHVGIIESLGTLRGGGGERLTNPILQLGGLSKGFGDKMRDFFLGRSGNVSQAIRLHFVDAYATQQLKRIGGEQFKRLANLVPKFEGLMDKKLNKQITQDATQVAIHAQPENIKLAAGDWTRARILHREVNDIVLQHPNLTSAVRDYILIQSRTGELFRGGLGSINDTIRASYDNLVDDFLRSPQRGWESFEALERELTAMEVQNPADVAQLIRHLESMSSLYGATPKQIIGRAVERTRGLSAADRELALERVRVDIKEFRDRAGVAMDKVVDKIKSSYINNPELRTSQSLELLNIQTAKRARMSEIGNEIDAWRDDWFRAGKPKGMSRQDWWNSYSNELRSRWNAANVEMADFDGLIHRAAMDIDSANGLTRFSRPAIVVKDRPLTPADVAAVLGCRGDDITRTLMTAQVAQMDRDMFTSYVYAMVREGDEGFTKEAIGEVYDQIMRSLHVQSGMADWLTMQEMELSGVAKDLHDLWNSKLLPEEDLTKIQKYFVDISDRVREEVFSGGTVKPEYTSYQQLRQEAMDEAHKWFYKEFTDYTHGNAFDAIMRAIYPFWTYESQRFYWLPRSFLRHPGTFTSYERWQDNTDYGYIHIPHTSVDINPFRGTIYGTLTTRLSKRDYPEYYDSLGFAGSLIEFNDALTRWGFYPGVHLTWPLALFGGTHPEFGQVLPPTIKTGVDMMVAALPDNSAVKWISDHVFHDNFRDYLTIQTVNRLGGDGTLIFSKRAEGEPLTDEEKSIWNQARRESAFYSAGFEQFGLFRLRSDEQYRMQEEASKVIEEMFGITKEQQVYARRHNIRLWDLIGGLTPDEQAVLEELGYYRWVGAARPLLPGNQQNVLNRIELGWDEASKYVDFIKSEKLSIEQDFINGAIGPSDYKGKLRRLYSQQDTYITSIMESLVTEPIPEGLSADERKDWVEKHSLMTIDGRAEYYKSTGEAQPVLHPLREIINLYYSIPLKEVTDPDTGQKITDWDTFWAERNMIDSAIPDQYRKEWEAFLTKNSTPLELLRKEIQKDYLQFYDNIYREIIKKFTAEEQSLIDEYRYLSDTNQDQARQDAISSISSSRGGMLMSEYQSELSSAKKALRYANPVLDAWLMFWGRTPTTLTSKAETIYNRINQQYRKVG